MIYIGIDPGLAGGIAALSDGGLLLTVAKMPATDRDILDLLGDIAGYSMTEGHPLAVLERVGVMPKQGIVSAFTFGKGIGGLRMALAATRIPFNEATPQTWQKALGCLTRGDKNISKARAQQLFPHLTVTHAIADALLLAEFCRRIHRGSVSARRDVDGKKEVRTAQGHTETAAGEEGHGQEKGRQQVGRTGTAKGDAGVRTQSGPSGNGGRPGQAPGQHRRAGRRNALQHGSTQGGGGI